MWYYPNNYRHFYTNNTIKTFKTCKKLNTVNRVPFETTTKQKQVIHLNLLFIYVVHRIKMYTFYQKRERDQNTEWIYQQTHKQNTDQQSHSDDVIRNCQHNYGNFQQYLNIYNNISAKYMNSVILILPSAFIYLLNQTPEVLHISFEGYRATISKQASFFKEKSAHASFNTTGYLKNK